MSEQTKSHATDRKGSAAVLCSAAFTLWLPEVRVSEWREAGWRWDGEHFAATFFAEEFFGPGRGENYSDGAGRDFHSKWRWGRGWMMRGLTEYECSPSGTSNLQRLTERLGALVMQPNDQPEPTPRDGATAS